MANKKTTDIMNLAIRFLTGVLIVALVAALASTRPPIIGRMPLAQREYFVALFTCGVIFVIFIFGLGSFSALAFSKIGLGNTNSRTQVHTLYHVIMITLNIGLLILFLYGRYIEPTWIRTARYTLNSTAVSSPVRIVHLSDIHMDNRFNVAYQIVSEVNAVQPDVIFFTGDALNTYSQQHAFRKLLSNLQAKSGKFAVRGNWDIWYWNTIDLFKGTGFREITAGCRKVTINGSSINICGNAYADNASAGDLSRTPQNANTYSIFLYHTPDFALEASQLGHDLYLCGHTHGGQVALPFYGALITLARHGKKYERGIYHVNNMTLNVNPGLGVEAGIPLRLFVRPEISVIDLIPGSAKPSIAGK